MKNRHYIMWRYHNQRITSLEWDIFGQRRKSAVVQRLGRLEVHRTNNKITECRLVNEESIFFLNFASWRGQDWSSGRLATAYSIDNDVSFRDSWWRIHRRIKVQERKWKHDEELAVVKERFQKVGEWKKLGSKFWRVREWCPRPVAV